MVGDEFCIGFRDGCLLPLSRISLADDFAVVTGSTFFFPGDPEETGVLDKSQRPLTSTKGRNELGQFQTSKKRC